MDRTDHEKQFCSDVVYVASQVGEATQLSENVRDDRGGGCIVIGKRNAIWFPVPVFLGGAERKDQEYGTKWDKYICYALAKAAFLAIHPDLVSSRQNLGLPATEQLLIGKEQVPGGGIALPDGTLLAFSGFSEETDEGIVLAVALDLNLIQSYQADSLAWIGHRNLQTVTIAQKLLENLPKS